MPLDSVEWLRRLIAFDTTSRNSNLELIACIRAYLVDECGLEKVVVQRAADDVHANLWATLPGEGGVTEGGIILSGHTDVVPVDGQKWDSDPFTLTERDGKLYARGTCDMKGFIAVCMALAPELLKMKRAKPIHFAWTYNEETDFAGIRQLVADAGIPVGAAAGCIIGEPTDFNFVVGHKGIRSSIVHLRGKAMHSSLVPYACNAIEHGAEIVRFLRDLGREFRDSGPFEREYDVPYTTVCPAMVEGGNARNTVPADCYITYEFRNIPGHSGKEIQKRIDDFVAATAQKMKEEDGSCGTESSCLDEQEAFKGRSDSRVCEALKAASEESCKMVLAPFCTEAPNYQMCGVDTIVWGPGGLCAHQPNEFVEAADLKKTERILLRALAQLTGSAVGSRL
ncbi:putative acetylornithine deacetylase-like [Trypanosoma cruzi]|nr:putative acetylornithine deacetylase-like [Trypanosoma cruzi]